MRLGGGLFAPDRDQLARYRAAVDAARTGAPLAVAVSTLTERGWSLIGDTLVRVPRGIDPAHPRADLLRHKSMALALDVGDPDWFTTPACVDAVARAWREVAPVLDWIGEHIGPTAP
jgi:uncharacterized protein (DUF2461 family)